MKLLDNKTIKKEKQLEVQRIDKLKKEETDLVKRINNLQEKEKDEKERIRKESSEFKNKYNIKKVELQKEIVNLKSQISVLEEKKLEAMKPVDILKKEVEKFWHKNIEKENELVFAKKDLEDKDNELQKRIEKLYQEEKELGKRKSALEIREKNAQKADDALKIASDALNVKKVEFDKEFKEKTRYLLHKEKQLNIKAKNNDNIRLANEDEANKLENEKIAIADKYSALAQAQIHLKQK